VELETGTIVVVVAVEKGIEDMVVLVQFNLKFTSQFLKKGKKKGNVGMKDSIIFMSATGGYSNR